MKRAIVVVLLAIAALALPATAAAAPARTNLFIAHLVGVQETPPNDSAAQGQVIMHVNADGTVSYKLIVANITNVTMAHIHVAPRGVPGPIKQWLYPESGPPPMPRSTRIACSRARIRRPRTRGRAPLDARLSGAQRFQAEHDRHRRICDCRQHREARQPRDRLDRSGRPSS